MNELIGVLTIKDKDENLIAIVYNDMKRRAQIFYKVEEMGVDEIKSLLDNKEVEKQ